MAACSLLGTPVVPEVVLRFHAPAVVRDRHYRRSVGPNDAEVNLSILHQMTTSIVDNNRMRNPVASKFPGCQ